MDGNERVVYEYTVIDQYGVEHTINGYSDRIEGRKLIIETVDGSQAEYLSGTMRKKNILSLDGPMPIFYNGDQL
jgi:hypothetical protein